MTSLRRLKTARCGLFWAQPMPYPLVKLAELPRSRPPNLRRVGLFSIRADTMGHAAPWPQRGTCPRHPLRTKSPPAPEPADVKTTARLLCRVVAAEQLPLVDFRAIGQHADAALSGCCLLDAGLAAQLGAVHRCGVGHADHRRSRLRLGATADGKRRKYCAGGSKCFFHGLNVANSAFFQLKRQNS